MYNGSKSHNSGPLVSLVKYLSVIQLVCGIITFMLLIALLATDFDENKDNLRFTVQMILGILLCLLGMGAGISGSKVSARNNGDENNSHRVLTMPMCIMAAAAGLMFIMYAGTITFYNVDQLEGGLNEQTNNYKGSFGMVVAILVMGFFHVLFSICILITCAIWTPNKSEKALPYELLDRKPYRGATTLPYDRPIRPRNDYITRGTYSAY